MRRSLALAPHLNSMARRSEGRNAAKAQVGSSTPPMCASSGRAQSFELGRTASSHGREHPELPKSARGPGPHHQLRTLEFLHRALQLINSSRNLRISLLRVSKCMFRAPRHHGTAHAPSKKCAPPLKSMSSVPCRDVSGLEVLEHRQDVRRCTRLQ